MASPQPSPHVKNVVCFVWWPHILYDPHAFCVVFRKKRPNPTQFVWFMLFVWEPSPMHFVCGFLLRKGTRLRITRFLMTEIRVYSRTRCDSFTQTPVQIWRNCRNAETARGIFSAREHDHGVSCSDLTAALQDIPPCRFFAKGQTWPRGARESAQHGGPMLLRMGCSSNPCFGCHVSRPIRPKISKIHARLGIARQKKHVCRPCAEPLCRNFL